MTWDTTDDMGPGDPDGLGLPELALRDRFLDLVGEGAPEGEPDDEPGSGLPGGGGGGQGRAGDREADDLDAMYERIRALSGKKFLGGPQRRHETRGNPGVGDDPAPGRDEGDGGGDPGEGASGSGVGDGQGPRQRGRGVNARPRRRRPVDAGGLEGQVTNPTPAKEEAAAKPAEQRAVELAAIQALAGARQVDRLPTKTSFTTAQFDAILKKMGLNAYGSWILVLEVPSEFKDEAYPLSDAQEVLITIRASSKAS